MKKFMSVPLALLICLALSLTALAANSELSRLYDGADLLNSAQEAELLEKLDSISEKHKVDLIVVTVKDLENRSADSYIEMFYDTNGYGYGPSRDGVMLLIAIYEREYRILSNGLGATAISNVDIDHIGDVIAPSLTSGDYFEAFNDYADECEYQINGEINGFPFEAGKNLIISLVIGFVVAFVATGVMRSKLKSVRRRTGSHEYTKEGSMNVSYSNDVYLYRTVSRRAKPKNNSSSGSRSSGSSRNVGGGRF